MVFFLLSEKHRLTLRGNQLDMSTLALDTDVQEEAKKRLAEEERRAAAVAERRKSLRRRNLTRLPRVTRRRSSRLGMRKATGCKNTV